MKNLNKNEISLLKHAITNEIERANDNVYIESKSNNERAIKRIEKYIKELKDIYEKL